MPWAVRASSALFGLALAIAIAPRLQGPAASDELAGALAQEGLNPRGPLYQWLAIVILPFAAALAAGLVIPKLRESRWALVAYCTAMASALLPLMHYGNLRHVLLHGAVGAAIVAGRRWQPRFSIEDVVLLPVLLSVYLALLDVGFGKTPAATFLRAAMIVFALRVIVRTPRALTLAPLALLFQMGWFERPVAGVVALVWVVATTLLERQAGWFAGLRGRQALTFVVYPLAFPAYVLALLGLFAPANVDFFEDGHDLLPASEMFRGEVPYRDIIPMHGVITDGGLSWLVMSTGHDSVGATLGTRRAVAALQVTALYFLTLAATGSAEMGALAALLSILFFPASATFLRPVPAIAALAAGCAAVRLRSSPWLLVAAVLCAVSFLVSIDFAIYSTLVILIASIRMRVWKIVALLAATVMVGALVFWPVLAEARVFVIGTLAPPECLRNLSAMAAFSSDPHCFSAIVWIVALVVAATGLAARPLRSGRGDAVLLIAMWVVVAGLSYVERRHFYYEAGVAPLLVAGLWRLRRRRFATALVILLVLMARPFSHVFDVATNMRRQSEIRSNAVESLPRSAGGRYADHVRRGLEAAQRFELAVGDTYYDFANAGLLYYLLQRDCPIPWLEVPLYQSAARQRGVIELLQRNPRVRSVLVSFPGDFSAIDGVSNRQRAPLVWRYVQENFEPAFSDAGVEFWRRKKVPRGTPPVIPNVSEGSGGAGGATTGRSTMLPPS